MKVIKLIKQNTVGFILGAIIFSVIGVYAGSSIASNEIIFKSKDNKWQVDNVESALNDLYSYQIPEEYVGIIEIIPTSNNIVLNTQDKLLKSDITINKIPSTYKNLPTATTATTNDILIGKTGYNNAGELITGNLNIQCVSGTLTTYSDCTTDTGCVLFEGFTPTIFTTKYFVNSSSNTFIQYYNASEDPNYFYLYKSDRAYQKVLLSDYYRIENNKLIYHNSLDSLKVDYVVCK